MDNVSFRPGDFVQVRALGTGVFRDLRNGGRCLVDIKGRALLVDVSQLSPAAPAPRRRRDAAVRVDSPEVPDTREPRAGRSLDLHGRTVAEAVEALDLFLNDMILAGQAEVRIVHGRSGGRIKAAVERRLRETTSVRRFRLDPGNPGVTIVSF